MSQGFKLYTFQDPVLSDILTMHRFLVEVVTAAGGDAVERILGEKRSAFANGGV